MKQGNQFYLEIQLMDENETLLDISSVSKAQFNIGTLTKNYDGTSQEVTYDTTNKCFKIWLTQNETFKFENNLKIDARILFTNNSIIGTYIENFYVFDSLKEVAINVETENN